MKTSENGLKIIKDYEKCVLHAYRDTGDVLTIGWGHTGPDVYEGMKISQATADLLLKEDVVEAEDCINALVKTPLTQNQFDGLVPFVFNIGGTAFKSSTMLKLLNQRDYLNASLQFARWNKDNGKVLVGLMKRRESERQLFVKI